jgi:leader peptidase (prepilin peptidase)/N-methyltransferase
MPFLLAFYAFAIGAIVGSFLNVVIHRYPREESIVFPPSHCPHCRARIRWFDNVPVASYLLLRGKCRACRGPIAIRYPLVELANGLFYLAIYLRTGPSLGFILLAAIVSMLIVLMYIDAEIQILPDVIDLPGIAIGLVMAAFSLAPVDSDLFVATSLLDSVAGALLGAAIPLVIMGVYWLVRRVEGMGLGDVKMLAMIGAVVGWRGVPLALMLAAVSGTLIGLPAAARSGRGMNHALPLGVFLGFGALAVLFFGQAMTEWYWTVVLR